MNRKLSFSNGNMNDRETRKRLSEEKKLAQKKLEGKYDAEETNPCTKEQDLTFKCLNDTNFTNKQKCEIYFDNYKACKMFWAKVQRDRRRQGIHPELPSYEEREKIKAARNKSA